MTAPEMYVRQGSRFVRADRARPVRPVPPIPTPVCVVDADSNIGPRESNERPNFTAVPVARCPHGSFARWAARNCCASRSPR